MKQSVRHSNYQDVQLYSIGQEQLNPSDKHSLQNFCLLLQQNF